MRASRVVSFSSQKGKWDEVLLEVEERAWWRRKEVTGRREAAEDWGMSVDNFTERTLRSLVLRTFLLIVWNLETTEEGRPGS